MSGTRELEQHHHGLAGTGELLGDPGADTVRAAHDDVVGRVRAPCSAEAPEDGTAPFRSSAMVWSATIARPSTAAAPTVVLKIGLLRRLLGQRHPVDPSCFGVFPAGKLRNLHGRPVPRLV